LFFSLLVSFCVFSQKQIDSLKINAKGEQLNEVIVTATRTEKEITDIPMPVLVVNKQQIKQSNAVRLDDVLSEQTGIITVPDFGGVEGVQIQGMASDYVMIMIDGVPLIGRSAGTLDLDRITVGNIEKIEVVKGASSSLYGSEALGGVINVITEKPKDGIKGELNFLAGANSLVDSYGNINYKEKKIGITAFLNRNSSSGYDFDPSTIQKTQEAFYNYTFNTNINYNLTRKTDLFFSSRLFTNTQDYIPNETDNGTATLDEFNIRAKLSTKLNNLWSLYFDNYVTKYQTKENLLNENNVLENESYFNQLFYRPEVRIQYSKNKNENIILGIGGTHESVERLLFLEDVSFTYGSIYAQYDKTLWNKLNIITGVRYDAHSNYQSQLSPKLAIGYKISKKISTKASIGYGYKAPDFRQLYFDFTNVNGGGYTVLGYEAVPIRIPELIALGEIDESGISVPLSEFENSSLRPESSITINWGFDFKPTNKIKFGINLFRNDFKDLIDTQVIARKNSGANVFSYHNVSEVYMQGLEFDTRINICKNLVFNAGYQLLYAKENTVEEAFENGNVFARDPETLSSFTLTKDDYFGLPNRSRHTANAKLFYEYKKLNINGNIRGTYRNKYALFDSNSNNYIDTYDEFVNGYSIWDIAVNKQIFKKYTLGVGADNVMDFTDKENITGIPGRIIYGKLNFKF